MDTTMVSWLSCPLDGCELSRHGSHLSCENGHCFDIARQGYVNLLPVQHKKSRQPGDSKAMVASRHAFLESGVYRPIADAMGDQLLARIPCEGRLRIMDAGCGEGYYTYALAQRLRVARPGLQVEWLGLDISKYAIQEAARRECGITWVVGSNRRPPVTPHSLDVILCTFGFQCFEHFYSALRPGGAILLVDPGPLHLLELRQVIYPQVRRRPAVSLDAALSCGFRLQSEEPLTFATAPLDNSRIRQLLMMTPHLYRASREGKQAAEQVIDLALTVDVVFRWLQADIRDVASPE